MRDNFRREFKKLLKLRVTNKSAVSIWVHYNELKFLENIIEKKKLLSSCGSSDDIETIVIEPSDDDDDDDEKDDNYSYIRQQQQEQHRLWLSSHQRVNSKRCCPHDPGDEFVNFFKSITPYLSIMNSSAKLRVRISIQQIILNELSRKIDATRREILNDCEVSSTPKKRVSNRVVKRNRKYI